MLKKVYYIDTEHAKLYGFEEAALLSHIIYWIGFNKKSGTNNHDGKTWTYNTHKAYSDFFGFWSEKQIRRMLSNLVEKGALVTGSFNNNPFNKTAWYALSDESILEESISPNGSIDTPKRAHVDAPKRANDIYRTDTNTDKTINTEAASCEALPVLPPSKKKRELQDWEKSIEVYQQIVEDAKERICSDPGLQQRRILCDFPGLDVRKSLERSIRNFWGTDAGWKNKKKCKSKEIDMVETLIKNIDKNKVYLPKDWSTTDDQATSHTEAPVKTMVSSTVIINRISKYFPGGIESSTFPEYADFRKWNEIYDRIGEVRNDVEKLEGVIADICKELEA